MSVYIQSIEKNPGNGAATIEMRGIPANMPLERISQCLGLAVSWLSWITTEDIKKTPDAQFEIKRRPTTDAEFVDQCGFLYGNIEKESDGEKILVLSFLYPEMPTNPDWARREKIFDDIVFSRMRSYVGDASLLSCSEGEGLRKYRFRSRKLPGDAGHTGGHPCLACFLNYLRNEFVEALRNKLGIKGPNPVSFVEALSEVGMSVPKNTRHPSQSRAEVFRSTFRLPRTRSRSAHRNRKTRPDRSSTSTWSRIGTFSSSRLQETSRQTSTIT